MQNLIKTLILTCISSSLHAESFTLSDEEKRAIEQKQACDETLTACDEALKHAERLIKSKNAIIDIRTSQIEELAKQNAELQSQRDSLWRNPLVWFLTGVVVGGLTYGIVAKTSF